MYKRQLFGEMEQRIDDSFAQLVYRFGYPRRQLAPRPTARRVDPASNAERRSAGPASTGGAAPVAAAGAAEAGAGVKVGRNAPCPCGSGKKYKKCCGA